MIARTKIDIVFSYKFMGVIFQYNNSFTEIIAYNISKANKDVFSLTALARQRSLKIQTTLYLFDRTVVPFLLYGFEVWGHENLEQLEMFQRKFLRRIMGVTYNAPNPMIYGELGNKHLEITIQQRVLTFWHRFENKPTGE